MDSLDRKIIAQLQEDGRASYAAIGVAVGLSTPAVKRRVDRLRDSGVITGFTATVDPAELGWTTEAFVEVYASGRAAMGVERLAATLPEVVAAYTVTGEADSLLHLRTRDMQQLETVLGTIRAERWVERTRSTVVLSRVG